jgi:hypothetical protein
MGYRVGGTIRRVKTARGTSYAIRFAHGDLKWTHRVGGSWEGWTEERVQYERERLSVLIERGEYVQPDPPKAAPVASVQGELTLPVAAAEFLERQRARARADKTVADLEWRLRHLVGFFGDVALSELRPARFEDFQIAKLKERQAIQEAQEAGTPLLEEYEDSRGRTCRRRRRGIDRAQINRILATLDRLLTDALRRDELLAHPAPGAARDARLVVRARQRSFLELYQADALLCAARGARGRAPRPDVGQGRADPLV